MKKALIQIDNAIFDMVQKVSDFFIVYLSFSLKMQKIFLAVSWFGTFVFWHVQYFKVAGVVIVPSLILSVFLFFYCIVRIEVIKLAVLRSKNSVEKLPDMSFRVIVLLFFILDFILLLLDEYFSALQFLRSLESGLFLLLQYVFICSDEPPTMKKRTFFIWGKQTAYS